MNASMVASSSLTFCLDTKSNRAADRKKIKTKKCFHPQTDAHPAFSSGTRTHCTRRCPEAYASMNCFHFLPDNQNLNQSVNGSLRSAARRAAGAVEPRVNQIIVIDNQDFMNASMAASSSLTFYLDRGRYAGAGGPHKK
jgi:hypothetical protein